MLVVLAPGPGGSTEEREPVTDYLYSLNPDRARVIEGRVGLLNLLEKHDRFPDPPFESVPGEKNLTQLVVDFDGEEHRVVFGSRRGFWLLVHAFLDEDATSQAAELRIATRRWNLPTEP
jgi:hypothetical protein